MISLFNQFPYQAHEYKWTVPDQSYEFSISEGNIEQYSFTFYSSEDVKRLFMESDFLNQGKCPGYLEYSPLFSPVWY